MPRVCLDGSIPDVSAALAAVRDVGVRLRADPGPDAFHEDEYAYTHRQENNSGHENHFQGCQRLSGGPYLAVSGGYWKRPMSHLFIVRLQTRPAHGPWGSNVDSGPQDKTRDCIIAREDLDQALWHAGGIDRCENYLAVPVECAHKGAWDRFWLRRLRGVKWPPCDADRSAVIVFDVAKPEAPVRLPQRIERPGQKATAVALTRLANRHYLAAVLSRETAQPHKDCRRLDFYLTRTADMRQGFSDQRTVWWDDQTEGGARFGDYQTINFVGDQAGRLFLIGFHNPAEATPLAARPDVADLFEVEIPDVEQAPAPGHEVISAPTLRAVPPLDRERFQEPRDHFNFDAGAAAHVEDGALYLYSVHHFRWFDGWLRLAEFTP